MSSVVALLSQMQVGAITAQPTAAQAVLSSTYVQSLDTGFCCGAGVRQTHYYPTSAFTAQNQGSTFDIYVCGGKVEQVNYTVDNKTTTPFFNNDTAACN